MKNLGMAYSIKKRNMAKGGLACAHGGPAYCNAGCYDQGGEVKNSADSLEKGLDYEEMADEKQSESNNYPQRPLMPEHFQYCEDNQNYPNKIHRSKLSKQ